MLNTVVSSDFATLINDLTLLDRFINSQIHEFSHTFILKDCTSIDGWSLGVPSFLYLLYFSYYNCKQCVIVTTVLNMDNISLVSYFLF